MAFQSLMHERNIYKERPDFAKIALDYPEFRKYAISDAKGKVRIDFTNHDALRVLTKILLEKDFNLKVEIPKGFLIPTVPQRLNYILWIEDLLTDLQERSEIPHGIDIGCGPCAIFSILGAKKNGWKFTATETSNDALNWALKNVNDNNLSSLINVVKVCPDYTLNEVLSSNENIYDFCLCNPPFYENVDEIRKKNAKVKGTIAMIAKEEEIVAEGGEVAFVKKIIDESFIFKNRIRMFCFFEQSFPKHHYPKFKWINLYTSMFGKKKSFLEILNVLQSLEDITFTKSQFCQGNTIRWGIAWTFLKSTCFKQAEIPKPKKSKKVKPPLIYHIPKGLEGVGYNVQEMSKYIWSILKEAKIAVKVIRSHQHYTESQISSNEDTWSHQRRKRRELRRSAINDDHVVQNLSEKSSKQTGESKSSLEDKSHSLSNEQPVIEAEFSSHKKIDVCDNSNNPNQTSFTSIDKVSLKRKISDDSSDLCKRQHLDVNLPNEDPNQTSFTSIDKVSLKRKISDDSSDLCKRQHLDVNLPNEDSNLLSTNASLITTDTPVSLQSCLSITSDERGKNHVVADNASICSDIKSGPMASQASKEEHTTSLGASSVATEIEHVELEKDVKQFIKKKVELNCEEKKSNLFQTKNLLFCVLKIRKAKDVILLEMDCPSDANRESLQQIFQFMKNKLK